MNKEQQIEKDRLIQIEEIDELIREKFHGQVAYRMDISKYGGFNGYTPLCTYDISKALYNAGYRKTLPNTELFTQNMKNVLEIEKNQAVKEFAEKLKEKFDGYDATSYNGYEEGFHDLQEEIDELLKEYEK